LLADEGWQLVVVLAEAHADGQEPWAKLKARAEAVYRPFTNDMTWSTGQRIASMLANQVAGQSAWAGAWNVVSDVRMFGTRAALPDWAQEGRRQANLLRHMFPNPFRLYSADRWPSSVIQLAQAIYNGAEAGFALHDALLEAGHPALAQHFQDEQCHPKGCRVLDLLLAKS
jgi:hypothetical protein